MARIEILPVEGLSLFATFCKLPRLLYGGTPGFAPPLDIERWTVFAHKLNPHYKLVEEQKFLARRDGQWVGRIAAHVYKPGVTPVGASAAQFGALDAIDDLEVVRALTGAAEDWLRAKSATRINGPFSPSVNKECGLLIEGFDATPMFYMPWHPPYLSRHLDALGYSKAQDLYSYRFEVSSDELNKPARISNRREWRDRLKLRPLNMKALKQGETALMAELFNDGWSGNWGFVPFSKEEFDSDADALQYLVPADFGIVVELDGVAQSFAIALPNLNEILSDLDGQLLPFGWLKALTRFKTHKFKSARLLLLGTRKSLQRSATGGAILLALIEELRRRGARLDVSHLEAGWVLEENMDMRRPIEMFGGKVDKIHRIYEKQLAAGDAGAASLTAQDASS